MKRPLIAILIASILLASCQSTTEQSTPTVEAAPRAIDVYSQVWDTFASSTADLSTSVNRAIGTLESYGADQALISVFLEDALESAESFEALEDFILNVDVPQSLYGSIYSALMAYADGDYDYTAILARLSSMQGVDAFIEAKLTELASSVTTSSQAEAFFSEYNALLAIAPNASAQLAGSIYDRLYEGAIEGIYSLMNPADFEAFLAQNAWLAGQDEAEGGRLTRLGTLLYELANGGYIGTTIREAAPIHDLPLDTIPSLVVDALASQREELIEDRTLLMDITGNLAFYSAMLSWYEAELTKDASAATSPAECNALAMRYSMLPSENLLAGIDSRCAELLEPIVHVASSIDELAAIAEEVSFFTENYPESESAVCVNSKLQPLQLIASEASTYRLLSVFARNIPQARWNSGFISRLESYLSTYGPDTVAYVEEHYESLSAALEGYLNN